MSSFNKNILILTDHSNHNEQNSLYAFAKAFKKNKAVKSVDVASRGLEINEAFFKKESTQLFATSITDQFAFTKKGKYLSENLKRVNKSEYDLIWLRLPPPIHLFFAQYLRQQFPNQLILNDPLGIVTTGNKSFLTRFSSFSPPMKLCNTIEDVLGFKKQFAIVLKPIKGYSGQGIIKIKDDKFWLGNQEISFEKFKIEFEKEKEYLAVKYLKNVNQGDKRIIVIDGQVFGASLRLPAKNSWLCNASMGGSSSHVEITPNEHSIIDMVNPVLLEHGIVMYGIDTLVDDHGQRVLSELNTTSIGGLPIIAQLTNEPLVEKAVELILKK